MVRLSARREDIQLCLLEVAGKFGATFIPAGYPYPTPIGYCVDWWEGKVYAVDFPQPERNLSEYVGCDDVLEVDGVDIYRLEESLRKALKDFKMRSGALRALPLKAQRV